MEEVGCIVCSSENSEKYTTLYDRLNTSIDKFSLYKCECGFLYLNPRPNSEEISQYYNSDDYDPHILSSYNFRSILYRYVQKFLFRWKLYIINKHYVKGRLVDIGGGVGNFVKYMSKKGWDVLLQEKFLLPSKDIDRVIDIKSLYDNEHKSKYNLITLWHSLEHIHKITDYFRAFDRILANKGTLLIAVPNFSATERYFYKNCYPLNIR